MEPKKYIIDLDQDPESRWDHIINATDPELLKAYAPFIDESLQFEFGWIGTYILPAVFWLLSLFANMFDNEYIRELRGIAKHTEKYGLTFSKLFQLNFGYDFLAACTSGVITIGEEKWHLRNMDWGRDAETANVLRDCTIEVSYQSNGEEIYRGTGWIGFVGLFTGISRNATDPYTISLNYRRIHGDNVWNVTRFFKGINPVTFIIRRELQSNRGSKVAHTHFTSCKLIAPCYLIMGTKRSGTCFTRHYKKCPRSEDGANGYNTSATSIVMTNIDYGIDTVDPKWADGDDLLLNAIERRQCFLTTMREQINEKIASNEKIDRMLKIMQTEPVFNSQTIYTVLMSPTTGEYMSQVYVK